MGVYDRLGVRPILNARGMNTMASGSLMAPSVLQAMAEAATVFVDMGELNAKAGQHIARLIGVEAAHVTSGSAGGLLLAAAACIAGDDPTRVAQLPDTTGLRSELVIQKCQRFRYDQAFRTAGGRLVEAGDTERCTPGQIEQVIGDQTAALIFVEAPHLGEQGVPGQVMIEIAHRRGLPIIVDAASTLPPVAHLTGWTSLGADLVIYSGGKGMRGPQGSGLLLGRPDLIRAAAANAAPNASVGRPCKVSKEDIIGLIAALEIFLVTDHQREWDQHVREAKQIMAALAGIEGIEPVLENDQSIWTAPTILIGIDAELTGLTPRQVEAALRAGDPPIMARVFGDRLLVDPHNLTPDEAAIVARRLREELAGVATAV